MPYCMGIFVRSVEEWQMGPHVIVSKFQVVTIFINCMGMVTHTVISPGPPAAHTLNQTNEGQTLTGEHTAPTNLSK